MIFKSISKDLQSEGITIDLINTINMDNNFSPVQINVGDEPTKLMQCSTGYWVVLEDGSVLKDQKGYYVVPVKDAQIGRARYLLNFKDQVEAEKAKRYESTIQEEIESLKKQVDVKVAKELSRMRQILLLSGKEEAQGLELILLQAIKEDTGNNPFSTYYRSKFTYEERVTAAKELVTDEFVIAYECLKNLSESGEYNILYQHYFQDGLPLVASFNHHPANHQTAFIKNFHRDKIMDTIAEIQEKDHLYMVAKFNLDKRNN